MKTKQQKTDIRDIVRAGVRTDRAAQSLKVYHQPRGGLTTYRKKCVASVSAPMVKGAVVRTIRIHELLHANNSPTRHSRKFHAIANAVEDVRVHSVYWPPTMPQRANRDCLATALTDIRSLPPMALVENSEQWNICLLVALRSLAIVRRLGSDKQQKQVLARAVACFSRN